MMERVPFELTDGMKLLKKNTVKGIRDPSKILFHEARRMMLTKTI
jgi:hypothetical protein